jgi:hypothetical protein
MSIPALSGLDRTTLNPIVRTILDSPSAEVTSWQLIPILEGRASPAGVYRVTGTAQKQDATVTWSLVAKVFEATALSDYEGNHASDDPTACFYWKRELLLYQSGLFDSLPDGFAAPRAYQIDEKPQGAQIWMEDIREDVGALWPISHYAHVARHFGRLSGSFMTERSLPTWPWLWYNYFPRELENNEWPEFYTSYPVLRRENALVRRGWSDALVEATQRLWLDRELFLQAMAQLPQTLQHNDSGRKNLFARRAASGDWETVAVDWGSTSTGVVGGELACIIAQPIYWFLGVHPDQLRELDGIAFDAYLQGLRDVGWHGDPAWVRLGYTASIALRINFLVFNVEWAARDEKTREFIESRVRHSIEEIAEVMRGLREYLAACAGEARQLITTLGIRTPA